MAPSMGVVVRIRWPAARDGGLCDARSCDDSVTESASAGTDTVQSSVAWTLGSNFENPDPGRALNINPGPGNSGG